MTNTMIMRLQLISNRRKIRLRLVRNEKQGSMSTHNKHDKEFLSLLVF